MVKTCWNLEPITAKLGKLHFAPIVRKNNTASKYLSPKSEVRKIRLSKRKQAINKISPNT